jgi:SAM-dependent methyltransferase
MTNEQALDANYWDERYDQHNDPWNIGRISTPLKEYVDQLTDKNISILIPGCGNSYEAEYLLENGFNNITLIDISPVLVRAIEGKLNEYNGKQLRIICNDFFNLKEQFDLIIEQTFFCALDPGLRESYVEKMNEVLKPAGKLVGVLFNRSFEGGPPFGGSKTEYLELFSKHFNVKTMDDCYNSIEPRKGSEVFVIFEKEN